MRPLARLQNSDSQQRYAVYAAQLVCYCLRVLENNENNAAETSPNDRTGNDVDSEATINDDEDDEDEASDAESGNREAETVTDVFKDAWKLFP